MPPPLWRGRSRVCDTAHQAPCEEGAQQEEHLVIAAPGDSQLHQRLGPQPAGPCILGSRHLHLTRRAREGPSPVT